MGDEPVYQTDIDPYGEWVDTNPAFSESMDGVWLIELGPPGVVFKLQDRLSAIITTGTIAGRGKFYAFTGEVAARHKHMKGTLSVMRTAVPWYTNDWTTGAERFDVTFELGWVGLNVWAGGELTREGARPLGSNWRKLSEPI